ncbi:MAG TPA: hypothetical protein VK957_00280 [Lunatimonas sp.]|nr:hypothetical protein [Lunatimonas sp.]
MGIHQDQFRSGPIHLALFGCGLNIRRNYGQGILIVINIPYQPIYPLEFAILTTSPLRTLTNKLAISRGVV